MSRRTGAFLLLVLTGCGSAIEAPPFRRMVPENRLGAVESVLARIGRPARAQPTNATGRPLVVVSAAGQVVAWDAEARRALWTARLEPRSRPIIAGEVVLVTVERDVLALDVRDGRVRFRVPVEESFLGGAASTDRLFLVFGSAPRHETGRPAAALVALDLATGEEIWRVDADQVFGAPAVAADLVFVPWGGSYLSAFATANGAETMRLRSEDDEIRWVEARPEGVFYGGTDAAYRLTARSATGTRAGQTRFAPPWPVALPAPVPTGRDAFSAAGAESRDGVRLYWQPAASDRADLPLSSDAVYLVTARTAFGITHADGKVRFATLLANPPVAGAATPDGLVLVDAQAGLVLVGRETGAPQPLATIAPTPAIGAAFDLGAFSPRGTTAEPPAPLRSQLVLVATDADALEEDLPYRRWAVQVLASLDDPVATADLVALANRSDLPEPIVGAALDSLQTRTTGSEPLLTELQKRYDWVAGTEPGPVAAIAQAMAQSHERAAVPLLLEHLDDPATDEPALAAVANALGVLGDPAALEPLFTFQQRYHSDPALGYRPLALREAAASILALGGNSVRWRLEAIAADPHALSYVRDAIGELLQPPPAAAN